jgi:hypothetical protein
LIIDNNIICYEYYKTKYTAPSTPQPSGAKDGEALDDKYLFNKDGYAVLVIEEDMVNKDGYGLKKGFYNVINDKYMDFLLIIQSGEIKAKVPILQTKFIESINPEQFKPKKMSYSKYIKKQQKEYRKYLDGQNPKEIELKTVQIQQLDEANSYILIYNTGNIEMSGIIRF